jgi:hypothetical protein
MHENVPFVEDRIVTFQDTMSQNDDGFLVSPLAKLCKTATLQIFLEAHSLDSLLTFQTKKQTKF